MDPRLRGGDNQVGFSSSWVDRRPTGHSRQVLRRCDNQVEFSSPCSAAGPGPLSGTTILGRLLPRPPAVPTAGTEELEGGEANRSQ